MLLIDIDDGNPEPGLFEDCAVVARLGNDAGVDNDEAGRAMHRCSGTERSWPSLWPDLQRLG